MALPFGFDNIQAFQRPGMFGGPSTADRLTQLLQQMRQQRVAGFQDQQQQLRQQAAQPPQPGEQQNPIIDAIQRIGGGPDMDPGAAGGLPGAGGFGGLSMGGAKRGAQIGSLLGMGMAGPLGLAAPALMGGIIGGIRERANAPAGTAGTPGGFMRAVDTGGGTGPGIAGGFTSQVDTGGVRGAPSRGSFGGGRRGGFGGGRDGGYSGGGFGSEVDTGGVL